ncbi:MAG TPA: sugar ABC transporter permease, partial [Trueperaceae bacterium]
MTTFTYVAGAVVLGVIVSFVVSSLLNSLKGSRWFYFPIILLPWMIPKVAIAIMWKWMLHDIYGIFNIILVNAHILNNPFHWLGHPVTAMLALILADVWYRAPFSILLLYAGMQRVPKEIHDASVMDGANSWQYFRYVILPYIKPELLISLVVTTMFVFREFGLPFVLTNGGPGDATKVLALTIYRQGNLLLRQGYASALSVMMLLITV